MFYIDGGTAFVQADKQMYTTEDGSLKLAGKPVICTFGLPQKLVDLVSKWHRFQFWVVTFFQKHFADNCSFRVFSAVTKLLLR